MFYVCVLIALVCFGYFLHKSFRPRDFVTGFMVGLLWLALIVLGYSKFIEGV